MITARQARDIAGPCVLESVGHVCQLIKAAALNREHEVSTNYGVFAVAGKECDKAVDTLVELGYNVEMNFHGPEHTTTIKW